MDSPLTYLMVFNVMFLSGIDSFDLLTHVTREPGKRRINYITALLALLGVLVFAMDVGNREYIAAAISSFFPMIHVFLYRKFHERFVRKHGREPIDVHHNWSPDIWDDRRFALRFFLLTVLGSFAILTPFLVGLSTYP